MSTKTLNEDLQEIISSPLINWNKLKNKNIFITGGTGLIGSILVKSVLLKNELEKTNIKMILLVRNKNEAEKIFGKNSYIDYIVSNIQDYNPVDMKIDYIIHGASPTKSKFFVESPVETNDIAVLGTKNILEQAKISNVKSFIYLSSMEMYGTIDCENVTEEMQGFINPLEARSSYSLGKRMCELYSYSYFKEYNIPVKIARLAQTFGAGISQKENRVYKIFADSVLEKKDIVLKTSGTTIINFSYTTDTVIGLLYILLNGKNGEAYNLVSEKTDMTIFDSAKWLAEKYGENKVNVIIEKANENNGFAPDNKMILSNEKLKELGWKPKYNLKQGYERLLNYMREVKENNN